MIALRRSPTMKHRTLYAFLLTVAAATPLAAGELLLPLTMGSAGGTTYSTRVWVSNTGAVPRRWTSTFIAPGSDGTRPHAGRTLTVGPGATLQVTDLAPAGRDGMLLISGAPQVMTTARLEAVGADGRLQAAVAVPLVGGRQLAAGHGTLHLHGLSNRQGGLVTDLLLLNASRQTAQCSVDAFGDGGAHLGATLHYSLPPRSVKAVARALPLFGATSVDEARLAVSCDQAFYAQARVYKPGSGELNLVAPSRALAAP
jgi:hypothetical protein